MYSEIIGALISFLCCLTPLAVLGLSMVGVGYLAGYIDLFALLLFAISMGIIGYGGYSKSRLAKERKEKCARC
ncbi:MAG: hypothetical protein H0X47_18955 [Nitrospirales bacterium]|nr:hypothetical protein [Nitrospirales bacterium]